MADALKKPETSLYERDFYAWTQDQAVKLRARAHNAVDWENAAEEIESLGDSEKSEIESRMGVLLVHLLKWRYQAEARSGSWKGSIFEQRFRLARRLKRSPSLRRYPSKVLAEEYGFARRKTSGETDLAEDIFPIECPFTIEEILDADFYPEAF